MPLKHNQPTNRLKMKENEKIDKYLTLLENKKKRETFG